MLVHGIVKPALPPFPLPSRFRRLEDAKQWLEESVVEVVSPLDAQAKAEFELTDEQEAWLEWMVEHEIQHVRLEP